MFRLYGANTDSICEHTMQQNATAFGAAPRTPLGELTARPSPDSLAGFKGWLRGGEGAGEKERGGTREGGGRTGAVSQ